jgi:hypothetical protein
MPLQDRTIFAPENKADISFFGSRIQKIHIYKTDGGTNTNSSKTGVVGRICKEVTLVNCDNLIIFKCTILERHYATKFLLVRKEYFNSGLHSTHWLKCFDFHIRALTRNSLPTRTSPIKDRRKVRCLCIKKNYNTSTHNLLTTINENAEKILTSYYLIVFYFFKKCLRHLECKLRNLYVDNSCMNAAI